MKKKGKWQNGNLWSLSADQMKGKFSTEGKGVKKPTAVEQKGKKWRIVHKPLKPGEFWD